MSLEANKAVVRRLFDEVINRGQLDAVDEIFSPAHVHYLGTQEFHAPTGHAVNYTGIDIFRLVDSKIVERRGLVDTTTLQQQVRGEAAAKP